MMEGEILLGGGGRFRGKERGDLCLGLEEGESDIQMGFIELDLAKLSKYEIKRGRQNSFLETTTHMQLKNVYENMSCKLNG